MDDDGAVAGPGPGANAADNAFQSGAPAPGLSPIQVCPPATTCADDNAPLPVNVGARPQGRPVRVLLVEDQPGDALLVSLALRESGSRRFHIVHVTTLAAALARLDEADVVLLDLTLPDSSGLATVRQVLAQSPDMPVVVMTGLDDPGLAGHALAAGAQDYLVKEDNPGREVERAISYAITRVGAQVERRSLLARLAAEQARVQDELAIARAMQFDLLPRPDRLREGLVGNGIAIESYFQPCSSIGGDLWGCQMVGDGRLAIFSFDFSGHGIGAALNVFRMHALINELREYLASPGILLTMLAVTLRKLLGRGQFATMFAAVLDCHRQELTWAGAGAPPPLLLSGDEAPSFLETRGLPLGVSARATYENRRVAFPRGSRLLIYSDALTEAPIRGGERIEGERLVALVRSVIAAHGDLRVAPLLDGFFAALSAPVEDDLTVLNLAWS